jgi:hypothetical protein
MHMEDPKAQAKDAPYVKVLLSDEQKIAVRVVAAMRGTSQSELLAHEKLDDIVAEYLESFPVRSAPDSAA